MIMLQVGNTAKQQPELSADRYIPKKTTLYQLAMHFLLPTISNKQEYTWIILPRYLLKLCLPIDISDKIQLIKSDAVTGKPKNPKVRS